MRTLTGIHTAHRVLRPARRVPALGRLAAGDRGAAADCLWVQLVWIHFLLQELRALQQRVKGTQADELSLHNQEADD